jgi:hypothetical protein
MSRKDTPLKILVHPRNIVSLPDIKTASDVEMLCVYDIALFAKRIFFARKNGIIKFDILLHSPS